MCEEGPFEKGRRILVGSEFLIEERLLNVFKRIPDNRLKKLGLEHDVR